jgi:two-component system nitrogen regulation sensor histidine kinase NtrY
LTHAADTTEAKAGPESATTSPGARRFAPRERGFSIGLIVVILSIASALATFLILTGLTPVVPRNNVVVWVLTINVALIAAMVVLIVWQLMGLWRAWTEKVAGARLHIRIVALFSVIAAVPALLLAGAATTTFFRSFDSVIALTRRVVESSQEIANQYLEQHARILRAEAQSMAKDLDADAGDGPVSLPRLQQRVLAQAGLRALSTAYIIDGAGQIRVVGIADTQHPYKPPEPATMREAADGKTPVGQPLGSRYFVALTKLASPPDSYLFISRRVEPRTFAYVQRADAALDEYNETRRRRGRYTVVHGIIYFLLSLSALLAAIWVGMWFADRFVAPIRRLIGAAQEVSKGNLSVALPERRGEGDLRRLSETFNTMTRELKTQRDDLVSANEQISERRRFIEAVLSGVSAGVIGLDGNNHVTLINRSAQQLLQLDGTAAIGKPLIEVAPGFDALLSREDGGMRARGQHDVALSVDGEERIFSARLTHEEAGEGDVGSVLTFDDITDLVTAQRTSAWADVARRIAHEIKNPLTPIILSAERIRRKYGKVITEDRDTFDKLTATIERQAGDIKTMVDEFASFARVPKPVMEPGDLREAVQEPVILFREGHPGVDYVLTVPQTPVTGVFDRRLITQAVTNLVKNATEAVEQDETRTQKGRVETRLVAAADRIAIEVIDNGVGLPKQQRARLLEPYVTTKGNKGTGLGLAIVQKIVEQHGGRLELEDAAASAAGQRGALVRITLPAAAATTEPKPHDSAARTEPRPGGKAVAHAD